MIKNIAKILTSHIIVKTIGLANIAFVLFFLSIKDFGDYSYLFLMLNLVAIIIDPFLSAYLIDSKTFDFNKYNFGIIIIGLLLSPFFYFLVKIINNNLSILLFVLFTGTYFFSAILKSYLNWESLKLTRKFCSWHAQIRYSLHRWKLKPRYEVFLMIFSFPCFLCKYVNFSANSFINGGYFIHFRHHFLIFRFFRHDTHRLGIRHLQYFIFINHLFRFLHFSKIVKFLRSFKTCRFNISVV